jgi:type II pantothenate kinase
MRREAREEGRRAAGVDVGATLVKLALRGEDGGTAFESLPAADLDRVSERLARWAPEELGLTGCGAPGLGPDWNARAVSIGEFEAWAAGARTLLTAAAEPAPERFLMVSLGTGTSALLVEPGSVTRVGGTALGGGTVVGLTAALTGERDFATIAELARRGDRRRVDLLISDVYPQGFMLPGDANAASFAKLSRSAVGGASLADLAHGVIGLVAENVGLICAGLAVRCDVERVVFGGSTLELGSTLTIILDVVCRMFGRSAHFLEDGRYAGALGALALGASGPEMRTAASSPIRR